MLCAHTVRRLKPGAFDHFAEMFRPPGQNPPPGWVGFTMLRGIADPNEVVTFGLFDGTLDELQDSQDDSGYRERREAVEPLVEAEIANGVYEIVETWTPERASTV